MKSPLKWIGGKRKLLDEIQANFPNFENINKYVEPFVGGGSVFFHILQNHNIDFVLNDINKPLINFYYSFLSNESYNLLLEHLDELIFEYKEVEDKKYWYYKLRKLYNCSDDTISKSAKLLILNKLCFNGLYRENKKGEFNSPYGYYKKPKFYEKENLDNIFKNFQEKNICCLTKHFYDLLYEVNFDENTFVYLDPPYLPINETSYFTSYNKKSFKEMDILNLRDFIYKLNDKKSKIMFSHQCENKEVKKLLYDLFSDFKFIEVSTKHAVANKNQKDIKEFLIKNY